MTIEKLIEILETTKKTGSVYVNGVPIHSVVITSEFSSLTGLLNSEKVNIITFSK